MERTRQENSPSGHTVPSTSPQPSAGHRMQGRAPAILNTVLSKSLNCRSKAKTLSSEPGQRFEAEKVTRLTFNKLGWNGLKPSFRSAGFASHNLGNRSITWISLKNQDWRRGCMHSTWGLLKRQSLWSHPKSPPLLRWPGKLVARSLGE